VILILALAGTLVSTLTTAVVLWLLIQYFLPTLPFAPSDCLYFGAAISATDPVTVLSIFGELHVQPDLNAIVLGESILNDALAAVLADSVDQFSKKLDHLFLSRFKGLQLNWNALIRNHTLIATSTNATSSSSGGPDSSNCLGYELLSLFEHVFTVLIGSLMIGMCVALVSALAVKFSRLRCHPPLDSTLLILSAYACFCAAESLGLSGVVALLSCGICHAHYTSGSLHPTSAKFTRQFSHLLAFLADNFVFAYLGASLFTYPGHYWHFGFALATAVAAQIGRAANIYPLSALTNLFGRRPKLSGKFQHVLFVSGLRGAMAYSLALRNTLTEPRRLVLSATCVLAMTSVLGAGAYTPSFLHWLDIPCTPPSRSSKSNHNLKLCSHCSKSSSESDDIDFDSQTIESFDANQSLWSVSIQDQSCDGTTIEPEVADKPSLSYDQELQSLLLDATRGDRHDKHRQSDPESTEDGRIGRFFSKADKCLMKPLFTDQQPTLLEFAPASLHWLARLLTSHKQMADRIALQTQSNLPSNEVVRLQTSLSRCSKCDCLFQ
jgi:NhaP-type Na+/H+ or K+/H+ antiporter